METIFLIGRILFGLYVLHNAYGHLAHHKATTGYAHSKGVPMAGFAVALTGVMLLIGGLSILLGYLPLFGIIILVAFLVPVTFIMHAFWKIQDPMQKMGETINFWKNMALVGALLMMTAIAQPWPMSL